MRVLITGADGLLGNNLVRELLNRSHEVSVLLLNNQLPALGLKDLPIQRFFGNILDKSALHQAFAGQDMVIHLAASTQVFPPRDSNIRAVNVTGTYNIIEACLEHWIKRLVHVGTANSFAPGNKHKPGNEKSGYNGYKYGLDYLDSKYEAQQLVVNAVKSKALNAVIVNPTFMIGPYDTKPSSGSLILALHKKKIPIFTHGSKTYIPAKDAAVAIANSLLLGQTGECYILGNDSLTYKEAFKLIAETIGVKPPAFSLPSPMVKFYGFCNSKFAQILARKPSVTKELAQLSCENHCYSGTKARQQLNLPHTELRIAVKECFEWFQQNNYTH